MSKTLTHLVLEIDLTHCAEDARVTIAKHLVSKALHSGILSAGDIASFLDIDECLMKVIAEECLVENPEAG